MEGSGLSGLLVVPKSVSLQGLDLACSMGAVLLSSSKLKQIFSSAFALLSSLVSIVPSWGDSGCVRKGSVPFLFLDSHLCHGVEGTGSSLPSPPVCLIDPWNSGIAIPESQRAELSLRAGRRVQATKERLNRCVGGGRQQQYQSRNGKNGKNCLSMGS